MTWTSQIESESSLPRATNKAEDGSKDGLRSDLRASNLQKFPWGAKDPPICYVLLHAIVLGRTNSILLPPVLTLIKAQSESLVAVYVAATVQKRFGSSEHLTK